MQSFMDWLANFLNSVLQWILDLVNSIFKSLKDLLMDVFKSILDSLLGVVVNIIGAIQFDAQAFNPAQYLAGAPAEFLSMLVTIGVPEAMGIIVAAIVIRFILQLIPVVRLGS